MTQNKIVGEPNINYTAKSNMQSNMQGGHYDEDDEQYRPKYHKYKGKYNQIKKNKNLN
jgi:hypothetical protein